MDHRQLQIFYAVVEKGSFTQAAQSLHIAQSAVSIAMRKLEEELDLRLLNRADRRVSVTAEGQRLLHHAELILGQFQSARQELAELKGMEQGEVRLGTSAMLGAYYFPEKITAFRQQYPHINIEISGEGTRRAQQLILDGDIDMGVVNMDDIPDTLEAFSLVDKEEVVACVSESHPFAKLEHLPISALAEIPLIVYREGYYLREIVESLCEQEGVSPNFAIETNLLRLMIRMIQEQQGIGFCLRRVVEQEEGLIGLSFSPEIYLNLGIAWKRKHYLSEANRRFVDFLLERKG